MIVTDKNRLPWDDRADWALLMAAGAMESAYRDTLEEPIPEHLAAILRRLECRESVEAGATGESSGSVAGGAARPSAQPCSASLAG
jgi:hypothetical protein